MLSDRETLHRLVDDLTGALGLLGLAARAADVAILWQSAPMGRETERHSVELEKIFSTCFEAGYQTVLEGGGEEPVYLPSATPASTPHRIVYRADYFASALHEVAHWCLAGEERRALEDYGYWYSPDGRDEAEQLAFEAAEARPQALESLFSETCGVAFNLSADNLAGGFGPSDRFAKAVEASRRVFLEDGLPDRAATFRAALERAFSTLED